MGYKGSGDGISAHFEIMQLVDLYEGAVPQLLVGMSQAEIEFKK